MNQIGDSNAQASGKVRLLVSACLLGDKVRFDGQHKYDQFVAEMLGQFVEWVRICPEVESGMPIPRPTMHLTGDPESPRLISRTGADLTEQMMEFTRRRLEELAGVEFCGYVCKKDSPSSGMKRVKVYGESGPAARNGSGLFTAAFMRRFPLIPVEEEGRLQDAVLRESFIQRIFCRRRWLDLVAGGVSRGRLVEFHSDHKFLLLAHGRVAYTELGRLVAAAADMPTDQLYARYEAGFMNAVAHHSTPAKTTDVLMHMMGFFKNHLTAEDKTELLQMIADYRAGLIPLIVPVTLVRHYVRKFEVAYLARQVFLNPYPAELMLRNHV